MQKPCQPQPDNAQQENEIWIKGGILKFLRILGTLLQPEGLSLDSRVQGMGWESRKCAPVSGTTSESRENVTDVT